MRTGLALLLGNLTGNLITMFAGLILGIDRLKLVGAGQSVAYLLGLLVYSRMFWRNRRTECR